MGQALPGLTHQVFYSWYFVILKWDEGKHPILDICCLNWYICYKKFQMVTLQSILPLLPENTWLASIKLQETLISTSPSARNIIIIFDFASAVIITSITSYHSDFWLNWWCSWNAVVVAFLLTEGCPGFSLHQLLAPGFPLCSPVTVRYLHNILSRLVLCVNLAKSFLQPTQVLEFIGAVRHIPWHSMFCTPQLRPLGPFSSSWVWWPPLFHDSLCKATYFSSGFWGSYGLWFIQAMVLTLPLNVLSIFHG